MKLPKGFRGGATAAGLKSTGAFDLTIIENQGPRFDAAAVFTRNTKLLQHQLFGRQGC